MGKNYFFNYCFRGEMNPGYRKSDAGDTIPSYAILFLRKLSLVFTNVFMRHGLLAVMLRWSDDVCVILSCAARTDCGHVVAFRECGRNTV